MTKFELYCLIYYALDSIWDDTKDIELGQFLSSANPFLFNEKGSADEDIYNQFKNTISNSVSIDNSYLLAKEYVKSLGINNVYTSFENITNDKWIECAKNYLSSPHKK